MNAARALVRAGQFAEAFKHLETAHVMGQRFVLPHVQTHWWMLVVGAKRRRPDEVWGQLVRIVLGALGSAVGVVPTGNTGGTDISMFRRLPVPERVKQLQGD